MNGVEDKVACLGGALVGAAGPPCAALLQAGAERGAPPRRSSAMRARPPPTTIQGVPVPWGVSQNDLEAVEDILSATSLGSPSPGAQRAEPSSQGGPPRVASVDASARRLAAAWRGPLNGGAGRRVGGALSGERSLLMSASDSQAICRREEGDEMSVAWNAARWLSAIFDIAERPVCRAL
ncbi:hypothetical protein HPB50_023019 [Hyalomma asiaticum]|uniref:Uncharacterized protein n=1 Tax=Hyalomma asiaticum TaxID=266040 RepID=A0ACB7S8P9_HYAAI|nr:hypothetical protein HPB50_023019 [Hyalomma asiaticum]